MVVYSECYRTKVDQPIGWIIFYLELIITLCTVSPQYCTVCNFSHAIYILEYSFIFNLYFSVTWERISLKMIQQKLFNHELSCTEKIWVSHWMLIIMAEVKWMTKCKKEFLFSYCVMMWIDLDMAQPKNNGSAHHRRPLFCIEITLHISFFGTCCIFSWTNCKKHQMCLRICDIFMLMLLRICYLQYIMNYNSKLIQLTSKLPLICLRVC